MDRQHAKVKNHWCKLRHGTIYTYCEREVGPWSGGVVVARGHDAIDEKVACNAFRAPAAETMRREAEGRRCTRPTGGATAFQHNPARPWPHALFTEYIVIVWYRRIGIRNSSRKKVSEIKSVLGPGVSSIRCIPIVLTFFPLMNNDIKKIISL